MVTKIEKSVSAIQVGGLHRHPHVLRCVVCKSVLDLIGGDTDAEILQEAKRLITRHCETRPDGDSISCAHAHCLHHVTVSQAVGKAIVRLSGNGYLFPTTMGTLLARFPFPKVTLSHPALPGLVWAFSSGELYVRISRETASIHLMAHPRLLYKDVFDNLGKKKLQSGIPERLKSVWEEIERLVGEHLPPLREKLVALFDERLRLAEMDTEFATKGDCHEH